MKTFIFGTSSQGLGIPAYRFTGSGPEILILGGIHGDEPEGVIAAHGLLNQFLGGFPYRLNLTLVPMANIDGVLSLSRVNARGVDLNRNMPTNDWSPTVAKERYFPGKAANSEPESQALVSYLSQHKPRLILSLHSWHPTLNVNGRCRIEAELISKLTGYPITEDIGYPTPGCLGTYAGLERDMPTLTYEIERGLCAKKIISIHVPAVLEALKVAEKERQ